MHGQPHIRFKIWSFWGNVLWCSILWGRQYPRQCSVQAAGWKNDESGLDFHQKAEIISFVRGPKWCLNAPFATTMNTGFLFPLYKARRWNLMPIQFRIQECLELCLQFSIRFHGVCSVKRKFDMLILFSNLALLKQCFYSGYVKSGYLWISPLVNTSAIVGYHSMCGMYCALFVPSDFIGIERK